MRQVGRELEREQCVVQVQVLADVLAERCIGWQLEQTAVVVGELELLGRAQHAVAFHAAQLANLDLERLAVFARWQFSAHGGAWHLDADARVRCAADDVQQLGAAHVDLAHAQTVCVGVLHGFLDFTDDDADERRRDGVELFHFQTSHGQGVGELLGGQRRVAELTQPGFRELHFLELFGVGLTRVLCLLISAGA